MRFSARAFVCSVVAPLCWLAACSEGTGHAPLADGGGAASGGRSGASGSSNSGGTNAGGAGGTAGSTGATAGVGGAGAFGAGGVGVGGSAGIGGGSSMPGGRCTEPLNPPTAAPCAYGEPNLSYCSLSAPSDVVMVICESFGLSQCEAGEACAPGWHLCSATEYQDRGGRTVPDDVTIVGSWIAGCARDTGTVFRDGVCSFCGSESGAPPAMVYQCDGSDIGPGMIDDAIGVLSARECQRIGENSALTAAYWSIYWAGSATAHSMCCLDGP